MSLGEPGERLRSGYCNLYQQGWYHKAGKPTTMSCHPGDLYPTREAAIADIDPKAAHLYLATALVQWEQPEGSWDVYTYPPDSEPTPLGESRRALARQAEVLIGQSNPEAIAAAEFVARHPEIDPYRFGQERFIRESGMDLSLDTSEREAEHGWKVGHQWAQEADKLAPWPADGATP